MSTPLFNEDDKNTSEEEIQEAFNNMYFDRGGVVEDVTPINLRIFGEQHGFTI